MVNRNLFSKYDLDHDQLAHELADADFGPEGSEWLPPESQSFQENKLLTGRILQVTGEQVLVDVGYKSEGIIELREWYDDAAGEVVPPRPGEEVQLLLQSFEDDSGAIVLSYRRARGQIEWDRFLKEHKEGDVVSGPVT